MSDMVGSVLATSDLPAPVRRLIAEKAEGNPLFVEEVTTSLLEEGVLALQSGRPVVEPGALALDPEALERAVMERKPVLLDALDLDLPKGTTRTAIHAPDQSTLRRALTQARAHDHALTPLVERIAAWRKDRYRVVLTAPSLSHAERLRMRGIRRRRADLLPTGALILQTVSEELGLDGFTVCDWGLREGILLNDLARSRRLDS